MTRQGRRDAPVTVGEFAVARGKFDVQVDDDEIIREVERLIDLRRDEFRDYATTFQPVNYPAGYIHNRPVVMPPDNLIVRASAQWEDYRAACIEAARRRLSYMKVIFQHAYAELIGTLELQASLDVNQAWAKRHRYPFTASNRAAFRDAQRFIGNHFVQRRYPNDSGKDVRVATPWPPIVLSRFAEWSDRLLPLWKRIAQVKRSFRSFDEIRQLPEWRDELKEPARKAARDLLQSISKARTPIAPAKYARRHAHLLLREAWPSDRGASDRTLQTLYGESREWRRRLDEVALSNFT